MGWGSGEEEELIPLFSLWALELQLREPLSSPPLPSSLPQDSSLHHCHVGLPGPEKRICPRPQGLPSNALASPAAGLPETGSSHFPLGSCVRSLSPLNHPAVRKPQRATRGGRGHAEESAQHGLPSPDPLPAEWPQLMPQEPGSPPDPPGPLYKKQYIFVVFHH